MIAFWNRAEVFVGPSEQDFLMMRNRLDEAGIHHICKVVSDNSVPGNRTIARSTMYYLYVHRRDAEAVAPVLR